MRNNDGGYFFWDVHINVNRAQIPNLSTNSTTEMII